MRTELVKIYTFEELAEEVQKKVIERWRNGNDLQFESDIITENFKEKLAEEGYKDCEVYWSLSCCQGDGVAFYGFPDIDKLIDLFYSNEHTKKRLKKIITLLDDCCFEIKRNQYASYYTHCYTMDLDFNYHYSIDDTKYPTLFKLVYQFVFKIREDIIRLSKELEREGYKQLDYYNSDEYIREELSYKSDSYEFLENGQRWY